MYIGEPIIRGSSLWILSTVIANPKSAILISLFETRIFAGFKSL